MSNRWGARDETIAASYAATVTPSDATVFDSPTRGVYVGGTGDLAVVMEGGGSVTFVSVLAGSILPIRCTQVLATGTTATAIISLF